MWEERALMIDVKHEHVPGTNIDLVIDRWRVRVFGLHLATAYRYDLLLQSRDHTSQWWLYVSPLDHLGIGINLPPWVSQRLGLKRDYEKP